jgi:hypothetical protein
MTLSNAELEILQAGKNALSERRSAKAKQQRNVDSFNMKRQEAAFEFRRKLFDQALQAAGVDTQALADRHSRDQDAIVRFMEMQKQESLAQAGEINNRHKAKAGECLARLSKIATPQSSAVALQVATEITLSGAGTASIAPGQNLAHTEAQISSGGYLGGPIRGDSVDIDWHFLWTPPSDGLLNASSFLQMNGASTLFVSSDCNGGDASSTVRAQISVWQLNGSGQLLGFDTQSGVLVDQTLQGTYCGTGASQTINLDEFDNVGAGRAFQFPTLANLPLLIVVSASLYVLVNNGQAYLDFLSGDYRLNVPFVFLNLS